MVRYHHQLNGHEFEQTPADSEGQGSLACCSPWGFKEPDTTERLITTRYTALFQENRGPPSLWSDCSLFYPVFSHMCKNEFSRHDSSTPFLSGAAITTATCVPCFTQSPWTKNPQTLTWAKMISQLTDCARSSLGKMQMWAAVITDPFLHR